MSIPPWALPGGPIAQTPGASSCPYTASMRHISQSRSAIRHPVVSALFALLLAMTLNAACSARDRAQRIVSLNLCTDQLLLELVEPERIRMLSQLAADTSLSVHARAARQFAAFDGSVESVMKMDPDLVLSGTLALSSSTQLLRRLGYQVELLEMPESMAATQRFMRDVAELVGEPARGERLLQDMQARIDRVRRTQPAAQRPAALVYLPDGISPGSGSLRHELLEIAGLRNLAAELGIRGYGIIALEKVVMASPRLLILDAVDIEHASLSRRVLGHPALANHVVVRAMPTRLWICGGPQIAAAAEYLLEYRLALTAAELTGLGGSAPRPDAAHALP